jgi:hypothetical protein
VAAPEAAPGHFCLYEGFSLNIQDVSLLDPQTGARPIAGAGSRFGVIVAVRPWSAGLTISTGSWAVTAP